MEDVKVLATVVAVPVMDPVLEIVTLLAILHVILPAQEHAIRLPAVLHVSQNLGTLFVLQTCILSMGYVQAVVLLSVLGLVQRAVFRSVQELATLMA